MNSIFGVDIDTQAVEVTKLSLMLKVLEGETSETIHETARLFHERALPDLSGNIKNGNSLIGPDAEIMARTDVDQINPFDWERGFPAVHHSGGFDAVIGNPPYDVLEKERDQASWPHEALRDYVGRVSDYEAAMGGKLNMYRFFVVRGLSLARIGGRVGMIVPLSLLSGISTAQTRKHWLFSLRQLVTDCFPQKDDPSRRVFRKAKLSTMVFTGERVGRLPERMAQVRVRTHPANAFSDQPREVTIRVSDAALLDEERLPIPLTDETNWKICAKVHSASGVVPLVRLPGIRITRGEVNQSIYREYISTNAGHARLLKGAEVGPYVLNEAMSQGSQEWFDERAFGRRRQPWPQAQLRRIATQRITGIDERHRIVAAITEPPAYFADSTNSVVLEQGSSYALEYLLGLLNSTLFQWRFKFTSSNNNVQVGELDRLPVRVIDFSSAGERAQHDRMVQLVGRMVELRTRTTRTPDERESVIRQVEALEGEIDLHVFTLYRLTPGDISVVMSTVNPALPVSA